MSLILVTGANGFIGKALCTCLRRAGVAFRGVVRGAEPASDRHADICPVGDLKRADLSATMTDVSTVIHLAGRAHGPAKKPLEARTDADVLMADRMIRAAVTQGVQRFILLSSIKVNGERTNGVPFTGADSPAPEDAYGEMKWEVERVVSAASGKIDACILRVPLVYGPGVKANFFSLLHAIARGMPLPLARIDNRRDLLYVGNLTSALMQVATLGGRTQGTYTVADGEAMSTTDLAMRLGLALGKPASLVYVPPGLMRAAGALAGKRSSVDRLLGSLEVDAVKFQHRFAWKPLYGVSEGLAETAAWYRQFHRL